MNHTVAKRLLFCLCLLPLARAAYIAFRGQAVNPIEFITHSTGTWTLTFLLFTLCISPLRRLSGAAWLLKYRRMLGLYAFFYGSLHFTTYLWFDQFFDLHGILHDVMKRPFITVGFSAFLLMLPLAITSTKGWIKRLKQRWRSLHRLIYPVAVLGVLHYCWLVKSDLTKPLLYALALSILLGERLIRAILARRKQAASAHD